MGVTTLSRGRYQQAGDGALADVAKDTDVPSHAVEQAEERQLVDELAASLPDDRLRQVLQVKFLRGTRDPLGYKQIAQTLGISIAAARKADRDITRHINAFAALYTAGKLCPKRKLSITSVVANTADAHRSRLRSATSHTARTAATSMSRTRAPSARPPSSARSPPRSPPSKATTAVVCASLGRRHRLGDPSLRPRQRLHRRSDGRKRRRPGHRHRRDVENRRRVPGERDRDHGVHDRACRARATDKPPVQTAPKRAKPEKREKPVGKHDRPETGWRPARAPW